MNRLNWMLMLVLAFWTIGTGRIARADLKDIVLQFHPNATVQEEYSNNINLTPNNKKDDFITTISTGISFSSWLKSAMKGELVKPTAPVDKDYGIDLNYRLGLVFYAHETDKNYVSHLGTLSAWYTIDKRLTFRVSEYLIRSEEGREQVYPGASPQFASGTFVDLPNLYLLGTQRQRAIYLRNVFSPSAEYQFSKEGLVSLGYTNNVYHSQSSTGEDSRENDFKAGLNYWFNIRHGISLQYDLMLGTFDRSPDLTGNTVSGRYTYRFNPRTSIFGDYAFSKRNYGSSATSVPSIDYDIHSPSIGIEHAFSPTLKGMAQLGYYWELPQTGKDQSAPSYKIMVSQAIKDTAFTLYVQGGYTEDLFTAENRGFTENHQVVGTVTRRLTEQLSAGLSASFEWAKSGIGQMSGPVLGSNERDTIWQISGNTSYQLFKWLGLSLALSYQEDHSNLPNRDYNEFRGSVSGTASF